MASCASQQLDILISILSSATKLTGASVGNMRNYAKEVGRMGAAVQSFSRINIPNLSTLVTQLEQLSKINLKGLDKKINLDIQINGGDGAGQLKYAIQKTLDSMKIDTSSMSKQLADIFGLKGSAATKLKQQVSDLAVDFAEAFDGNKFNLNGMNLDALLDDMAKTISENGQVLRSSFGDALGGVMDEYKELYDYFNSHKIYVSDFLKAGVGKTEFNDLLQRNLRYITRDASKGIKLNDSWDELTDRFPTLLSKDTINDAEQLVSVLEAISRARDEIKPISIQDLTGDTKNAASVIMHLI